MFEPYNGGRGKHTCPQCGGKKKYKRYINKAGQIYADHVGRCDRQDSCRYDYPPSRYFADNPQQPESWKDSNAWQTTYTPTATATQQKPIDYLPWGLLEASQKYFEKNNLVIYLASLFGWEKALELAREYNLGTSKKWTNDGGYAVDFWQVDRAGNIRQCKVMAYSPHTGRRLKAAEGEKEKFVAFMGKVILKNKADANLQQCLFGEHLLTRYPEAPVCLVESEKTALIMAGFLPGFVWLATGGKNGARWTDREVYKALEGRQVVLYPDLGAFDAWKEKSKLLATVCDVTVSDLLERKAQGNDWEQGYDIADYFIKDHQQPQEAPQQAPAMEEKPEAIRSAQGLPEGFTVAQNGVLEYNGIPFDWYNPEEQEQALAGLEGADVLPVFQAINPLVGELIERFGLEV